MIDLDLVKTIEKDKTMKVVVEEKYPDTAIVTVTKTKGKRTCIHLNTKALEALGYNSEKNCYLHLFKNFNVDEDGNLGTVLGILTEAKVKAGGKVSKGALINKLTQNAHQKVLGDKLTDEDSIELELFKVNGGACTFTKYENKITLNKGESINIEETNA